MESPARVPFQFLPPHQEILLLAILHLQSPFMKLKFWRNFLKIDLNLSLLKFRNEISCCRRNFERNKSHIKHLSRGDTGYLYFWLLWTRAGPLPLKIKNVKVSLTRTNPRLFRQSTLEFDFQSFFLEISSIFNIHPSGSLISRVLKPIKDPILELNEP